MLNRFANKEMKIIVMSQSSGTRTTFTSVLKKMNYNEITGVSSFKDIIELAETTSIDWIICPVVDGNGHNVLQLLSLINDTPQIRFTKVSCYFEDAQEILPKLYQYGLMSHHQTAITMDDVEKELQNLVELLEKEDGNYARTAASYLRKYLSEQNLLSELLSMEKAFLAAYPGDRDCLLSLAETMFKMNLTDAAKQALYHFSLIEPESEEISTLLKQYTGEWDFSEEDTKNIAQMMGFNSALIVDANEEERLKCDDLLKTMGFRQISSFSDPRLAMKHIRSHKDTPVDLLVSEWQLPIIPGPVFLYKIRNRLAIKSPLLLNTAHIRDVEKPMIQELGASTVVDKPIKEGDFQKSILWTINEHNNPKDPNILKFKIKQAIAQNDKRGLAKLKKKVAASPALSDGEKLLVEAEIAFSNTCYLHAKKNALAALHEGAPSTEALELLGRSLIKLRDFDGAIRCLKNVSMVSPYNVDHLCDIAECHLENGNNDEFQKTLDQAKSIDQGRRVVETEAKGAIQTGHTETARKLLTKLKSFKDVLAYTNNRAVALIHAGKFDQGIELYKKALDSLPENKPELEALVLYNLGLAHARHNNLEQALGELNRVKTCKNLARRRRINSLKKKITQSLENNVPLVLTGGAIPNEEAEEKKQEELRNLEMSIANARSISRVDYCLHKIFSTAIASEKAETMTANMPKFHFRGSLKKDFGGLKAAS